MCVCVCVYVTCASSVTLTVNSVTVCITDSDHIISFTPQLCLSVPMLITALLSCMAREICCVGCNHSIRPNKRLLSLEPSKWVLMHEEY